MAVEWQDWHGCYKGGWNGLIVPGAFAHPAKFSYALISRIFAFGIERGFWSPGQLVGDPFGGVGLGGVVAAYQGLRWIGCELEPRFVDLAEQNFRLHRAKWEAVGDPLPVILRGDSRRFADLIGRLDGCACSPPFGERRDGCGIALTGATSSTRLGQSTLADGVVTSPPYAENPGTPSLGHMGKDDWGKDGRDIVTRRGLSTGYGETEGQIGQLREGSVDAVVTSPPYNANEKSDRTGQERDDKTGHRQGKGCFKTSECYGDAPGQIGGLKEGSVDAVVTSPPYANSMTPGNKNHGHEHRQDLATQAGHGRLGGGQLANANWYSHDKDNIGNLSDGAAKGRIDALPSGSLAGGEATETYWSAMATVYGQVRQALRPGAVMAVVLKDYVRNGCRVPLCDQTCTLLERSGFTVFLRCRAWLVSESEHTTLFDGTVTRRRSRKSFFRRLAEAKGSPEINWEEVVWATTAPFTPLNPALQ